MLNQILKMAGVNIDPKKINQITEFTLEKLNSLEQALTGIDASLKDIVEELKKRGAE